MADKLVTKESLAEAYPELIAEIQKESREKGFSEGEAKMKEGMAQAVEKACKEGAIAEQARIKSIKALSIPGHEALIETLMFDGETTGEQAAMKVLAAEKTLRESKLAAFQAEGKEIKVPVVEGSETGGQKDFEALVEAHMAEHNCSRGKAVEAVAKTYPKEHKAWINKINKKEVK